MQFRVITEVMSRECKLPSNCQVQYTDLCMLSRKGTTIILLLPALARFSIKSVSKFKLKVFVVSGKGCSHLDQND